ncbi:MAG: acetolactate synthase [Verrucomicrobia bacterium]|nr:acetolactate synthase [Verrucomicrobiota bacterium]
MPPPTKSPPGSKTARARPGPMVHQFSVFLENKCGRLLDLTRLFGQTNIHILGLSVVDTTDSAVVRLVVDDPDKTTEIFRENQIPFSDTEIIVAELPHGPDALAAILTALLQAEINIYYTYGLIVRPRDKPLLAFHVEEQELAADILRQKGFFTLGQADLSR